jgi:hypothetical protein
MRPSDLILRRGSADYAFQESVNRSRVAPRGPFVMSNVLFLEIERLI